MISSIRGWLTGRKDEPEFPSYSELRLTPTRPLPAELQEQERGADFSTRCDALRSELLQLARRPPDDEPRFFEFLSPTKRGVVTITLPDNGGPCLPVFSTAFRAEDYRRTQLGPDFRVGWLRSSPEALLRMLHDVAWIAARAARPSWPSTVVRSRHRMHWLLYGPRKRHASVRAWNCTWRMRMSWLTGGASMWREMWRWKQWGM
jgi:hypothetical protein